LKFHELIKSRYKSLSAECQTNLQGLFTQANLIPSTWRAFTSSLNRSQGARTQQRGSANFTGIYAGQKRQHSKFKSKTILFWLSRMVRTFPVLIIFISILLLATSAHFLLSTNQLKQVTQGLTRWFIQKLVHHFLKKNGNMAFCFFVRLAKSLTWQAITTLTVSLSIYIVYHRI